MDLYLRIFIAVILFVCLYAAPIDLICRKCGNTITTSAELINRTSPTKAKYDYVFPIADKNLSISVFENPAGQTFHVVASKTGNLHFQGDASHDASWFPGMHWIICVCSTCKQHMGWYFKMNDDPTNDKKNFVGLVLTNIISASYTDQLMKTPGSSEN
ncbi:unnamed protein product, partial [Mesorhabditis belari]|uniref:Protein yippee-like n=1 Tax=Mesorhabditis belari TaxID=2138241 RepID=A0AAF3JAZ4_9BILA